MTYLFDGINHPTVAQVQAAGAAGCLMYGGTPGDGLGKDFTAPQYASYKAAGMLTAFVYENSANDMGSGMAGGAAHATALLADLRSKGVANSEPIGATVDEHVTAANLPLAVQYQAGFYRQAIALGWAGARGGYGFAEFLIAIHNAGVADWYWGAGNRSALPPYTNIWQDNTGVLTVGGSADDRDWILIPLPGGTDMAVTDPLPVKRPDGSVPTVGDAIGNMYLAEFYGGPDAGPGLYPTLAAIKAQLTGQGAQISALSTAVAALSQANAANQPITKDELAVIVDQAVAQHIQITGTVQVQATAP